MSDSEPPALCPRSLLTFMVFLRNYSFLSNIISYFLYFRKNRRDKTDEMSIQTFSSALPNFLDLHYHLLAENTFIKPRSIDKEQCMTKAAQEKSLVLIRCEPFHSVFLLWSFIQKQQYSNFTKVIRKYLSWGSSS